MLHRNGLTLETKYPTVELQGTHLHMQIVIRTTLSHWLISHSKNSMFSCFNCLSFYRLSNLSDPPFINQIFAPILGLFDQVCENTLFVIKGSTPSFCPYLSLNSLHKHVHTLTPHSSIAYSSPVPLFRSKQKARVYSGPSRFTLNTAHTSRPESAVLNLWKWRTDSYQ